MSQGSNHMSAQLLPQWQTSSLDENVDSQSQQDLKGSEEINQKGSDTENQLQQVDPSQELNYLPLQQKQAYDECHQAQDEVHIPPSVAMHNSEKIPVHIQEPDRIHISEGESQFLKIQKLGNQQAMATGMNNQQALVAGMSNQQALATGMGNQQTIATGTNNQQAMTAGMGNQQAVSSDMSNQQPMSAGQAINAMNRGKQVPFALLLPVIQNQLDKDRAMQLQTLYFKLKNNEISKDGFIRHMRSIVGDQMLKMAVYKLQAQGARNLQTGPNQFQSQSQASSQHLQMPSIGSKQFSDCQSSAFPSHVSSSTVQVSTPSTHPTMDSNAQISRDIEAPSDSRGMQVSQMASTSLSALNQEWESSAFPIQGLSKQQQQHLHFSQGSLSTYGSTGGNYHPYSTSVITTHDMQTRQVPVHQSMGTSQAGTTTQANSMMNVPKFERQNSFNEPKKMQGSSLAHLGNNPALQQTSSHWQSSINKELKNGASSSVSYVKQEPVDQSNDQQKKSHLYTPHGLSSFSSPPVEEGSAISGTLKDESSDMQSSRMNFSTPSTLPSNSVSSSMPKPMDPSIPVGSRIPSAAPPVPPTSNMKTPPKKPSIGQKKPLETLGSSPPLSSKKQKVSGAFLDQSIEQLNDVTAVSGVNLREEEEQLLSGTKEDGRVSEASRKIVQEEEERLILQKFPLQKKLAEIMTKCGVKSISNDVERCLSLSVEERLRGLVSSLIRISKQRIDIEKPRHRTIITSDVRQQIMIMNQKAREEWEKKQAEAEKLQKMNEPEGGTGVDGDKEKDEGRVKSVKANKEEDDKMRATAANVAARAAVGGDDMLSKWQLMAEQARQKREGGIDVASGSQPGKDGGRKPVSTSVQNARENQEAVKRSHSTAATPSSIRNFGRNQFVPQNSVARSISAKDVIAYLEREPQMSKSTLMYCLYEKMRADTLPESS